MKRVNIIYWIITSLVGLAFIMSSVMYLTRNEDIVKGFQFIGFPAYLIPFLGIAKAAGVIGIFQTQSHTLKEWAYAGLVFNLVGATYVHIAMDMSFVSPLIFLLLVFASYFLYHRKTSLQRNVQFSH